MNKNQIGALVAGTALAALTVGCSDAANTNTANANLNANSNTAVVVNNNGNANTAGVTTTNANSTTTTTTRRTYNANITKEEYEKDKTRYSSEAKEAGETIGSGVTDGWLWVKAKAALAAENDLRDSTINVDVDNSVISLRGNVSNNEQVKKADAVVKKLDGVKSVKNMLKASADGAATNANHNANKNANH